MAHDCPNTKRETIFPAVMIIPFASGSVKLASQDRVDEGRKIQFVRQIIPANVGT